MPAHELIPGRPRYGQVAWFDVLVDGKLKVYGTVADWAVDNAKRLQRENPTSKVVIVDHRMGQVLPVDQFEPRPDSPALYRLEIVYPSGKRTVCSPRMMTAVQMRQFVATIPDGVRDVKFDVISDYTNYSEFEVATPIDNLKSQIHRLRETTLARRILSAL